MRKYFLYGMLVASCLIFLIAAKPAGINQFNHLWVSSTPTTDTSDVTVGDNDVYIKGTLEVDGAIRFDGDLTTNGALSTATEVSVTLPLNDAVVSGTGPIAADGTTAPGIIDCNGALSIIYADSSETTSVGWTFIVPPDYSSGLNFRMFFVSGSASLNDSYANLGVGWSMTVQNPGAAFDTVASEQSVVYVTSANTYGSPEALAFTPEANVLSDVDSGDSVTVWFWNGDTRGVGDGAPPSDSAEFRAIEYRYTRL